MHAINMTVMCDAWHDFPVQMLDMVKYHHVQLESFICSSSQTVCMVSLQMTALMHLRLTCPKLSDMSDPSFVAAAPIPHRPVVEN